jgi:hypothetical protein
LWPSHWLQQEWGLLLRADPVYNWQHLNRTTGLPDGNDLFDKTIVEARAAYGCNDLSFDPCANGNGTAGTVTIFYN